MVTAAFATLPVAAEAQYRGDGSYHAAPRPDGARGGYDDRYVGYGRDPRVYRGRDDQGRRPRCREDGTGGAIIGAIAGGLLGNSLAGYRDRAAGTILGGVGGALAGRAIDRGC
jgi:hypothetical protein